LVGFLFSKRYVKYCVEAGKMVYVAKKYPGLYDMCRKLAGILGRDAESFSRTVRNHVKQILSALSEEDIVEIWRKTR